MSDRAAFLAAIRESPGEDTPRLAYADWLDENGDAWDQRRARLIRRQILERPGSKRRPVLYASDVRDFSLWPFGPTTLQIRHRRRDNAFVLTNRGFGPLATGATVRRGFVEGVRLSAEAWFYTAEMLRAEHPLTRVRLTTGVIRTWETNAILVLATEAGGRFETRITWLGRDRVEPLRDTLARVWPGIEFGSVRGACNG